MATTRRPPTRHELLNEIDALRGRLGEIEDVLRAIRSGEVNAFYVGGTNGACVRALEDTESAYRALVEAMNEGAAILTVDGKLLYCNLRLAGLLKAPLENVMGAALTQFVSPGCRDSLESLLRAGRTGSCAGETYLRCQDGLPVPVRLSLSPMKVREQPRVCAVVTDLTERNRVEEELRGLSLVDELTGLFNRRGFFAFAQQQMKMARRLKERQMLVFVDLDGLKQINDTLGHREGDRALNDAADVLRKTFRESDIAARLGGDEFAVLAMGGVDTRPEALVMRLRSQILSFNARGQRLYELSMSVGIASADPDAAEPLADLLARADAAMYEEKRRRHGGAVDRRGGVVVPMRFVSDGGVASC